MNPTADLAHSASQTPADRYGLVLDESFGGVDPRVLADVEDPDLDEANAGSSGFGATLVFAGLAAFVTLAARLPVWLGS
jgi:hypothetical protein